jgi:hypothetical protein
MWVPEGRSTERAHGRCARTARIVAHGGHFEYSMSKSRVTHVIAVTLPNNKIGQLQRCVLMLPSVSGGE